MFDRLNIAPEKKPDHRGRGVLIIGGVRTSLTEVKLIT
jgi:hypothetical protein